MYCPKCGAPSIEAEQRFCKSCGTNLKAVNDVLEKGDSKINVFGVDVGNIVQSIKDTVEGEKFGKMARESGDDLADKEPLRKVRRQRHRSYEHWLEHEQYKTKVEEERAKRQQLRVLKPKEWMAYSWQHNLKHGLLSLCSGAGLGIFLYYLGRMAIESGLLLEVAPKMEVTSTAIEPIARMLWLIAAIPVLKGLGQIFYAAFFAESMAVLSERFAPRALPRENEEKFLFASSPSRNTAPQAERTPVFDGLEDAPPSVTESTTRTLEEARAKRGQYE